MKNTSIYLSFIVIWMLAIFTSCQKNKPDVPATVTYKVVFNSNQGSKVDTQLVKNGEKAVKPKDPTRSKYVFTGWYPNGATTAFDFNTSITTDIKLTALWKPVTNETTFDEFMRTARFMPNDPRQMTADDKAWFSANATYDFSFVIQPIGFTLTAKQEAQYSMMFEGILNTLNYMSYTKPIALATKAMFADRAFYYDTTNADKPDSLPSVVGTLLMMRGLNTNMLANKVFILKLNKRSVGQYKGSITKPVFGPERDHFTPEEFAAGRRLSYLLPTDRSFGANMDIPLGENLEFLKDYTTYWMYDITSLNALYTTNPDFPWLPGYSYVLAVHELLHSLLHWNHAGGGTETDLVYAYSGMYGEMMDMFSGSRHILVNSKLIPSTSNVETSAAELTQEFGGHMPMICYNKAPFAFGHRKGTYNLYTTFLENKLKVPVYNPTFPVGNIFLNYTTGPNAGDPKGVPVDFMEGITWNVKYKGIQP